MKKIGIVVQRYGLEVNGGAEYHARVLANKLKHYYDVEVITTTALDYQTWENYYPQGTTTIDGIKVHRFPSFKRKPKQMRKAKRILGNKRKYFKIIKKIGLYSFLEKKKIFEPTAKHALNWLESQGPHTPELINFIESQKDNYDMFIFFTYLYYPTVLGMELVSEKALFIPTAHDEPPLYYLPYKDLFSKPKFIMYNTQSEKELVEKVFPNAVKNNDVAGIGIDKFSLPTAAQPPIVGDYFVYIGRIEASKGCNELVDYFTKYNKQHNTHYKLVMIGKNFSNIKPTADILLPGFVSEEKKYEFLKNSKALIIPSKYESLSLVTLEAMLEGVPVIANQNCEVLKQHIDLSKSGTYYTDYANFKKAINYIIHMPAEERKIQAKNAQAYVSKNYMWDKIIDKFQKAIEIYF